MKISLKYVILLIIIIFVSFYIIYKNIDYAQNEQFALKSIKGEITEYVETDYGTIIVLYHSGINSQKKVLIGEHTVYSDCETMSTIMNRTCGIWICVESEYQVNEIYNENGPPWIFPATTISKIKK